MRKLLLMMLVGLAAAAPGRPTSIVPEQLKGLIGAAVVVSSRGLDDLDQISADNLFGQVARRRLLAGGLRTSGLNGEILEIELRVTKEDSRSITLYAVAVSVALRESVLLLRGRKADKARAITWSRTEVFVTRSPQVKERMQETVDDLVGEFVEGVRVAQQTR